MSGFTTFPNWLADKLNYVSGFSLVTIMSLSCADIILRCFRMPIPGVYEIVGFLGAIMISFAMAKTTLDRSHVAVEIIVVKLPRPVQKLVFVLTDLVMMTIFILLSYETVVYGSSFMDSGERSLTLQLPIHPVLFGMAFAFGVSVLIPLTDIVMVGLKGCDAWFQWNDPKPEK